MSTDTVAELMALALRVKDTGGAYDYGDGDEAPYREARDALEQAIRRAVDCAVNAEREACAKLAELQHPQDWPFIATAIRARNKP